MKKAIALFVSSRTVIKGERLLKANAIPCTIIPVPKHLSSECGMALEIAIEDIPKVDSLLHNAMLDVRFESCAGT